MDITFQILKNRDNRHKMYMRYSVLNVAICKIQDLTLIIKRPLRYLATTNPIKSKNVK
jgi:hypothetical protein